MQQLSLQKSSRLLGLAKFFLYNVHEGKKAAYLLMVVQEKGFSREINKTALRLN